MSLRWDWLRPVVAVPFVPTIGPVHPSVLTLDLFADTVTAASTNRFLHYDKDIRWSSSKTETVLVTDIVHRPGLTLIPTLLQRGTATVKVHVYATQPDSTRVATDLAHELAARHGTAQAKIIRFAGPEVPHARGTRIQLKDFTTHPCPAPEGPVRPLHQWPRHTRASFEELAAELAADGFAFLYRQMRNARVGPVLTAVVNETVAGAIGPMEIRPDAIAVPQLMPQYFGVRKKYRGTGLGKLLWRAAMHWGQTHGAAYQLLQTAVGSPSDNLCRTEGLTALGHTSTQTC
ncbi:GNAT family N-acetyltransferase [Streptomyces maremycinicus]|nr:GNAT family N-acetyltransferase [Streptomyces sp. B9173]